MEHVEGVYRFNPQPERAFLNYGFGFNSCHVICVETLGEAVEVYNEREENEILHFHPSNETLIIPMEFL